MIWSTTMNTLYNLQKQMGNNSQLLPQQQAILNQQHLINQQYGQPPPVIGPIKRGRKPKNPEDGEKRKRRKKDPNRPKRAMTPYFYFTSDYRNNLRKEGKMVPGVKEVAQYCGPKWNSMDDNEKKPFIELAEVDRRRYLNEMNIYKKPRDEEKPKRPASAYFHFLVEFRQKMAGKPLPEHTTIPKLSGALWQKMTEEERRPYNDKMEAEKKIYEKNLAEYRKMKAEEAITNAAALKTQQTSAPAAPAAQPSPSFQPQQQQESFPQLTHDKPAQSSQVPALSHTLSPQPEQVQQQHDHKQHQLNLQLQQLQQQAHQHEQDNGSGQFNWSQIQQLQQLHNYQQQQNNFAMMYNASKAAKAVSPEQHMAMSEAQQLTQQQRMSQLMNSQQQILHQQQHSANPHQHSPHMMQPHTPLSPNQLMSPPAHPLSPQQMYAREAHSLSPQMMGSIPVSPQMMSREPQMQHSEGASPQMSQQGMLSHEQPVSSQQMQPAQQMQPTQQMQPAQQMLSMYDQQQQSSSHQAQHNLPQYGNDEEEEDDEADEDDDDEDDEEKE